jgi:hypothetical protein
MIFPRNRSSYQSNQSDLVSKLPPRDYSSTLVIQDLILILLLFLIGCLKECSHSTTISFLLLPTPCCIVSGANFSAVSGALATAIYSLLRLLSAAEFARELGLLCGLFDLERTAIIALHHNELLRHSFRLPRDCLVNDITVRKM